MEMNICNLWQFIINIKDTISENALLLSVLGTFLTALATLVIAHQTRKAAKATETATQAQLLLKFLDEYRSIEMLYSLETLRKWKDDYPENFNNYRLLLNSSEKDTVNKSRRKLKSYFFNALDLYEAKLANDQFMKSVCGVREIDLLFDIVEPIEYSLAEYIDIASKSDAHVDTYQYKSNLEPEFKKKFDTLRKIRKKYR